MTTSIRQLKKVQLSLLAGSDSAACRLPSSPVNFTFLYGIGSGGICPFEAELYEKSPGDSLRLTLAAGEGPEFFGHLLGPLLRVFDLQTLPETMSLQIEVTTVADADNREVVKAMAMVGGHGGCGGSCGCGCG